MGGSRVRDVPYFALNTNPGLRSLNDQCFVDDSVSHLSRLLFSQET